MSFRQVHFTELNEFLTDSFLNYRSNFEIELKATTTDGFVNINTKVTDKDFTGENLDFDLSGCECSGLFDISYKDLLNKAVYTASPYELIEFLLSSLSRLKMLICMKEGSWVVQILGYED